MTILEYHNFSKSQDLGPGTGSCGNYSINLFEKKALCFIIKIHPFPSYPHKCCCDKKKSCFHATHSSLYKTVPMTWCLWRHIKSKYIEGHTHTHTNKSFQYTTPCKLAIVWQSYIDQCRPRIHQKHQHLFAYFIKHTTNRYTLFMYIYMFCFFFVGERFSLWGTLTLSSFQSITVELTIL